MDIDKVGSMQTSSQVKNTKNNMADKDMFLKILAAELSNPDPLNAKDNTQYITQLAQFSSLEQSQNLFSSMTKLLQSQQITEGSMMIGRKVEFQVGDNKFIGDNVRSVRVIQNEICLECDKGTYKIDQVAGVGGVENDKKDGGTTEKPKTI